MSNTHSDAGGRGGVTGESATLLLRWRRKGKAWNGGEKKLGLGTARRLRHRIWGNSLLPKSKNKGLILLNKTRGGRKSPGIGRNLGGKILRGETQETFPKERSFIMRLLGEKVQNKPPLGWMCDVDHATGQRNSV